MDCNINTEAIVKYVFLSTIMNLLLCISSWGLEILGSSLALERDYASWRTLLIQDLLVMGDESRHRDKRERHHRKKRIRDDDDRRSRRHKSHRTEPVRRDQELVAERNAVDEFDEEMWEEKPQGLSFKEENTLKAGRQSWMTETKIEGETDPFTSFLGPIKEKKPIEKPKPKGLVISSRELNTGLLNHSPTPSDAEEDKYTPPDYTIGDAGSSWRMMKLKNLYAAAKETMKPVEELALERMGSLRAFDEAREEEQELERRKRDRRTDGVLKVKVTGELYLQRLAKERKKHRRHEERNQFIKSVDSNQRQPDIPLISQSELNKLRAAVLRAEMANSPDAKRLAVEYADAVERFNTQSIAPEVITLATSHSTLLPHLSREQSKSSVDMTIEDMLKEERATKRIATVDRIARDSRYRNDLDYLDENAERLAMPTKRKETDLKSLSIQEHKKQERIMANCPLCFKDDGHGPLAPAISLATRTYLSLPTEPELTSLGAIIVPIRHGRNLAECDDDEWEEIRV